MTNGFTIVLSGVNPFGRVSLTPALSTISGPASPTSAGTAPAMAPPSANFLNLGSLNPPPFLPRNGLKFLFLLRVPLDWLPLNPLAISRTSSAAKRRSNILLLSFPLPSEILIGESNPSAACCACCAASAVSISKSIPFANCCAIASAASAVLLLSATNCVRMPAFLLRLLLICLSDLSTFRNPVAKSLTLSCLFCLRGSESP